MNLRKIDIIFQSQRKAYLSIYPFIKSLLKILDKDFILYSFCPFLVKLILNITFQKLNQGDTIWLKMLHSKEAWWWLS